MRRSIALLPACVLVSFFFLFSPAVQAQQYKLKQSTTVMGMKTESTIYVKGMRKRTETAPMMGIVTNPTIEQCDLQRTITLNDKKKLYYIEPFSKNQEEVIDDDAKTPVTKPVTPTKTKEGGIIYMWYRIIDTNERKDMYGFKARHIWTDQKMKPSADACTMKDSIIIKTDGWYIDLPQFNCPVRYSTRPAMPSNYQKPNCTDRFVTHTSGKGKLGFPLILKTTIIMGGERSTTMETNLETLELITGKLDSMLFEIPPGYKQASSLEELQEKIDPMAMAKEYMEQNKNKAATDEVTTEDQAGVMKIGVFEPTGDENIKSQAPVLQQYIVDNLKTARLKAVSVSSEEDAKAKGCSMVLRTNFDRFKQASKVGGLIKAIKNTDPNAASSFNIDAGMVVTNLADGKTKLTEKISGKYEGSAENAAKKNLQEGCEKVINDLN